MTISLLGVKDVDTRRAIRDLMREVDRLTKRVSAVVSEEGSFIGNLGINTTMSASSGDLGVTSGSITELNSLDDVTDGSTYLRVAGVDGSNQIQAASISAGAVEEAAIGTGAVTNTKIGALAVDTAELAAGAVSDAKIEAGADIQPTKILISGAVNLDDWRDSGDATKIAAAELAGSTPNALNIATTNPETAGFVRAGSVRAMNAIGTDGITISGNLVNDVTGADDGASVWGVSVPTSSSASLDTSATGGGGTGEGGDPVEP